MATVITNPSQLNKLIEGKIQLAMRATQQIIYDCIQDSINEYYREYSPATYQRTYKLMNSLVKTEIVHVGNEFRCEVKIDEDYLNYTYPNKMGTKLTATGRDILEWSNEYALHGGTEQGEVKIWDDAVQALSGEFGIITLLKQNLQKRGIPIN